jgi:hypothetical protein
MNDSAIPNTMHHSASQSSMSSDNNFPSQTTFNPSNLSTKEEVKAEQEYKVYKPMDHM